MPFYFLIEPNIAVQILDSLELIHTMREHSPAPYCRSRLSTSPHLFSACPINCFLYCHNKMVLFFVYRKLSFIVGVVHCYLILFNHKGYHPSLKAHKANGKSQLMMLHPPDVDHLPSFFCNCSFMYVRVYCKR